ncbi:hypothetical protein BCR43DRAFT_519402 [Syncephalastrum racemosum]|uniref:Uncharacterized protein n=1 Tax=Syncephalastrum racemosum TaxID=13706 RepID=A0A1X2GYZ6_SYNRA|nr:hypothetical protein BCR43DRAFT_519402 [Syncephalastrum racemosum]
MACLVFDSQTEFGPKENTSAQRSARVNQALNAAKRSYRKRHTRDRVLNYVSAYTRFTRAIKGPNFSGMAMLTKYQCHAYDTDNLVPLSFLVSDREADAQMGGTKFAVQNNEEKRLLINLGLKHEEENSDEKAEMRLAVVAAVAGNDYANNPRDAGLRKLCNMVNQIELQVKIRQRTFSTAGVISRVYEFEKNPYAAALLQFCRLRGLQVSLQDTLVTVTVPITVDSSLSDQMYAPFLSKKVPPGPQEQGSRYTPVATLSVPKTFTQPERIDPVRKKASQEKRERGSSSRSLNSPDDADIAKPRS